MAADEELVLALDIDEVEQAVNAYGGLGDEIEVIGDAVRDADSEFERVIAHAVEMADSLHLAGDAAQQLGFGVLPVERVEELADAAQDAAQSVSGLGTTTEATADKIETAFERAGRKANAFWKNLNPGVKAAALFTGLSIAINSVERAIGLVARAATAPARAFAAEEKAVTALTVALGSLNEFNEDTVRGLQARADALQKTTSFSNTDIIATQAILTQLGGATAETLERAEMAALDVSAALNKSLKDSMIGLGKAFQGNTDSVREWGLVLDSTVPKGELLAHVLDIIEDRFGGTAELQAQGLVGQVTQLKNAWLDLLKVVGQGAVVFLPVFQFLEEQFTKLNDRFVTIGLGALSARPGIESLKESIAEMADKLTDVSGQEFIAGMDEENKKLAVSIARNNQLLNDFATDAKSLKLQLEFSIAGGDRAEQAEIFKALEEITERAAELGQQSVIDAIEVMKEIVSQKLTVTVEADARNAQTVIKNLRTQLAGEQKIDVKFAVNSEQIDKLFAKMKEVDNAAIGPRLEVTGFAPFVTSIDEMLAQVEDATAEPLTFDVEAFDGRNFVRVIREHRAEAAELLAFEEELKIKLPTLNEEELDDITQTMTKLFSDSINEGFGRGIEGAKQTAERLVPVMQLLKKEGQIRADVLVDAKGITALESIQKRMRAAQNAGGLKLIDSAEITKAESLEAALQDTLSTMLAMQKVVDAPTQRGLVQGALDSLDKLADDLPDRAAEILAFKQVLLDQSGLALEITVDTEEAERDAAALGRVLIQLLEKTGAAPVDIIDAKMLAATGDNVAELRGELDRVFDSMTDIQKAEISEDLFDSLAIEMGTAEAASTSLSTGVVSDFSKMSRAAAILAKQYRDLAKFTELSVRFSIAIEREQFAAAKQILNELDALVEQFPDAVQLEIDVSRLRKTFDELVKDADEVAEELQEAFRRGVTDIGLQGAEDTFSAMFQSITSNAESFGDRMVSIIRAMIDQMIRELVRFAIASIALGIATGGGSAAAGFVFEPGFSTTGKGSLDSSGDPSLGQGKTSAGLGGFRRSAVPVAASSTSSRNDRQIESLSRAVSSLGTSIAASSATSFLDTVEPVQRVPLAAATQFTPASRGIEGSVRNSLAQTSTSQTFNIQAFDSNDIRRSLLSRKPGSLGGEITRATIAGRL